MKTKALFIYRVNQRDQTNHGVLLKLKGQQQALRALGAQADTVYHSGNKLLLNDQIIHVWSKRLPKFWKKWCFYTPLKKEKFLSYNLYILRYGLATPSFIEMLDFIYKKNQGARIFIDMPTYPYRYEWSGLYGMIALKIDNWYCDKLKSYVKGVLHSGPEKEIFGIPTLFFSNGVDVDTIPARDPALSENYELIAIGKWQYWHGLDRLIEGINDFAQSGGQGIRLTVVGQGPELRHLKKLVQDYQLEGFVRFMGVCMGKNLDDLINLSDLGIGTLALHRKKVRLDSSLKHREYVARGLPFVMSGKDADGLEKKSFTYVVPGDESPVNLNELIAYVDNTRKNKQLIQEMNEYAREQLSWKVKMSTLLKQTAIIE